MNLLGADCGELNVKYLLVRGVFINQFPASVAHLVGGGTGKSNEDIRFKRKHKET